MSNFNRAASVLGMAIALSFTSQVRAADEAITVVARLQASPGREAELEARLVKVAEFVHRAEPGHTYFFLRSTKTPGLFLSYEIYPSMAALGVHGKVTLPAASKELGPLPEGLLARPMEFELLQPIEASK